MLAAYSRVYGCRLRWRGGVGGPCLDGAVVESSRWVDEDSVSGEGAEVGREGRVGRAAASCSRQAAFWTVTKRSCFFIWASGMESSLSREEAGEGARAGIRLIEAFPFPEGRYKERVI